MNVSADVEKRIEYLEKAVASVLSSDGDRSRTNELFLQLILLSFQCLHRNRHEYASSLRLMASHSTFAATGSRQQILDQIARYEMESELMTGLLDSAISKLGKQPPLQSAQAGSWPST